MKKKLPIIGIVLGVIIAVIGIAMKYKQAYSISIIGGADGPTSIFLAGKLGGDFSLAFIIVGAVVIAASLLIKQKK